MPIATNMGQVMKFADAFHIAAIVSTLSAKSLHRMEQIAGRCTSRRGIVTTTNKPSRERM
jgi:hypothetical protein